MRASCSIGNVHVTVCDPVDNRTRDILKGVRCALSSVCSRRFCAMTLLAATFFLIFCPLAPRPDAGERLLGNRMRLPVRDQGSWACAFSGGEMPVCILLPAFVTILSSCLLVR
jgi:hypothetical protein